MGNYYNYFVDCFSKKDNEKKEIENILNENNNCGKKEKQNLFPINYSYSHEISLTFYNKIQKVSIYIKNIEDKYIK